MKLYNWQFAPNCRRVRMFVLEKGLDLPAISEVIGDHLRLVLDSTTLHRPRALVDPVGGDTLPDGRLVIADANADPLKLGEDGTHKGVYGTGPGAIVAVDPDAATLTTLIADERFVTPLCVRRVRP